MPTFAGLYAMAGEGTALRHFLAGWADPVTEILEDGDIYFLYRPRLAAEQVDSLDDIQRLLWCFARGETSFCGCSWWDASGSRRSPSMSAPGGSWTAWCAGPRNCTRRWTSEPT